MPRLTKTVVDQAFPRTAGAYYVWDDKIAGFGVRIFPSGAKRYVFKYRSHGGGRSAPQRWLAVGTHGAITAEQARTLAQQASYAVLNGEDPQAAKIAGRVAPTLIDVWSRFERDYLPLLKAQTARTYRSEWRDYIEPNLGSMKVAAISRSDVDRLHKQLRNTPYGANRVLALCSRLFSLAEAWEWRSQGSNPCRFVQRFPERARTRFLSADELIRVGTALNAQVAEGRILPAAARAIRLLLLTGARLNEILTAKWEWVIWEANVIALPDSKTGAKPIYIGDEAMIVLKEQQVASADRNSDYVFPGRSHGHMINLGKSWKRVCAAANITGVRLHDLRHTAASIAVAQGATLPIIGRLLGHSQAQTTMRYAHVDTDPAIRAANLIGKVLGDAWQLNRQDLFGRTEWPTTVRDCR